VIVNARTTEVLGEEKAPLGRFSGLLANRRRLMNISRTYSMSKFGGERGSSSASFTKRQ
jgi:hypothetical protein